MASLSSCANTIIGNTTTAYDAVYALIYDKSAWLRQSGQSWLITRATIRFGDVLQATSASGYGGGVYSDLSRPARAALTFRSR
jgi:hypothetical protein